MLQNIRNNIQGTVAKVIIGLIIVPFALFGIDSFFNSSSQSSVAAINGEKISESELQQAITMQKRRLISVMGDQINPAMLDDAILRQPALNGLLKQSLLLQAAEDTGLSVSKSQLNAAIVGMSQFQENGVFSQARYEQVLRSMGYSSGFFKQLLSSDLLLQQLTSGVSGSSFVARPQLSRVVGLLHEQRDYQYIPVAVTPFEKSLRLADADISAYYEQHKNEFSSEEKIKLSYIELREEQFHQPVPDELLQAEYQRLRDGSDSKVEREAAHILVEVNDQRSVDSAVALATSINEKLAAGADFAALAKEFSDDPGSANIGGNLGLTKGDSFPTAFEQALAALQVAEVSAPVETEAGIHVIKLISERKPSVPSFDDAKSEITQRLQSQVARPKLARAVEELSDLVFNADGLAMPAKQLEVEVKQSDWLSRASNLGVFASKDVKRAAFDLLAEDDRALNSDVIEISDKHSVVIHIEDHQAAQPLPLASVRNEITQRLSKLKAIELAGELAEQLKTEIMAGARVEAVAKKHGLEWQAVAAGKRNDFAVRADVRNSAFSMSTGASDAVDVVTVQNGDLAVIHLLAVSAGDIMALNTATVTEAENTAGSYESSRQFSLFFNELWESSEIKVN